MKRILFISLILLLAAFAAYSLVGGNRVFKHPEVGQAIDSLNGVMVYYNGSVSHVAGRNVAADGYNLGLKYQCVEFVKRYYYQHLKHKMPDSYGHAKDFFDAAVRDGQKNKKRNLTQYTNGSLSKPKANDLVIEDGNAFNPYGHVFIIARVEDTEIEIIQQNPGPGAPSRLKIKLQQQNGKWRIMDEAVLGWLRKE
ncbi:MAG: CHAP domain-containing protein [Bacteroidia bacterium]